MNTRTMMKDAVTTNSLTPGGHLNPTQERTFREYLYGSQAFLNDVDHEVMVAPEKLIDTLQIGSRIIRTAIEGQGPNELAGVSFPRKMLRTTKVRLAADITTEFGEDNIERERALDHIARSLATQFANDLDDLMLNGDTTATGDDAAFLNIGDGIIKQAKDSAETHKFDTGAWANIQDDDYKSKIFPGMIDLLPNKFRHNMADLRIYCSWNTLDRYIRSLTLRETSLGDNLVQTGNQVRYYGFNLFPCDHMPNEYLILTGRHNLVTGVQRGMRILKEYSNRKDLTEYTMYMRLDPGKIIWDDALVIAGPGLANGSGTKPVDDDI